MESFLFARLANPLQLSEHLGIFVEVQSVNHMKTYSFAKVSARGYLTQADYNNKYIFTDDLKIVINVSGRDFEKPQEFFEERGISFDTTGGKGDYVHNADEWDYNLKSLTNYQEQIGNKTQTLMIYLQDFIGQYNSYQEGAMSAISSGTQTLRTIARGQ
jgi:hypothetical protein